MAVLFESRFMLAAALLTMPAALAAQSVVTEISGIDGEMRANVQASLSLEQAEDLEQVSVWRLRQMAAEAREEVRQALEPFGFYSANVSVRLEEPAGEAAPWRARVQIAPGEPVIVNAVAISISEPASTVEAFNAWRAGWPLPEGSVLRHRPYEQSLSDLEQIAESHGFFDARFARRVIRVDPERNEAGIEVDYAAGNRYVIGEIDYGDTGSTRI